MWSNSRSESETERRRRMREEERDDLNDNDVKRQAGLWMVFILGAAAIGNVFALRRRLLNIERQSMRGNSSHYGGEYSSSGQNNRWNQGTSGNQTHHEDRSTQEAQRRWQAHLDEQQRRGRDNLLAQLREGKRVVRKVMILQERIRRKQEVFAREKASQTNAYNTWHERHGDKWDWRWEGDRWEWKGEEQRQRAQREQNWQRNEGKKHFNTYELLKRARLAYHFDVLGLDATRAQAYSDADIKAAFRSKAFEYHPDQNPDDILERPLQPMMIGRESLLPDEQGYFDTRYRCRGVTLGLYVCRHKYICVFEC